MEIFHNGNTTAVKATPSHITDEQIKFILHGFVQVWNKFEDVLARELAVTTGMEKSGGPESRLNANHDILFRVGGTLNSQPGLTMGELSHALSVPLSTATRVVNSLVDQGFVQRLHDMEDRRIVRVSLTPRGQELYQFIENHIAVRIREIASYLTENEMATLIALLGRVALAVKEASK